MQVLALILIGVAAGTIGLINNNDLLEALRDADRDTLSDDFKDFQDLIIRSLGAAGWLIVLGGGVIIAEIVAIILVVVLGIAQAQVLQLIIQIIVSCIFVLLQQRNNHVLFACRTYYSVSQRQFAMVLLAFRVQCSPQGGQSPQSGVTSQLTLSKWIVTKCL